VDNRFFIKTEENLQAKHLEEGSQKGGTRQVPRPPPLKDITACALLGLIRQSPSCLLQLSTFWNIIHTTLNVLMKQWICAEQWI